MNLNKHYREDGMVAVLYSPGYGAGWFSWNEELPDCLYEPRIVTMLLSNQSRNDIQTKAQEIWPNGYWSGARDLKIQWMRPGSEFSVHEYDGFESIKYADEQQWQVA